MSKRKTDEELLAELEAKKSQLDARIQKKRAAVRTRQRKRDTRRKIIAGALALEHAAINDEFGNELKRIIYRFVKRDADKQLFDEFFELE